LERLDLNIDRPKVFYKYHKLDKHLLELISTGYFWFSAQMDLNDPYDCKYSLSDQYLLKLLKNSSSHLLKDLQESVPQFKDISSDRFFEIMLPILKNEEWMNGFYNMLFKEGLGWCVSCFTTEPTNEIMWAHYADSNKGVCLEFDLSTSPDLHKKIFPVQYNDNFPVINSVDDLPEALLRKRIAWQYEKEWRILANARGAKPFNKASLTAIYFGCSVSKKKIDEIRKLMIESDYKQVDFKQFNFYINKVKFTPLDDFPFPKNIKP
jgi:hypothetical protein